MVTDAPFSGYKIIILNEDEGVYMERRFCADRNIPQDILTKALAQEARVAIHLLLDRSRRGSHILEEILG